MSTPDIAELLRKGIEAAREGKRKEARALFEQVVELDEKNEKGWFWLASVVDSDEERRICLGNVLHINPNNERAKRALDALQAKAKEQKTAVAQEEVVAGVSRRQLTLVIGLGAVVVILILIVALVVIVGNNNRAAAERATAVAVAQAATSGMATSLAAAANATGTTVAGTATQAAMITPIPPTAAIATLPPTWTLTPPPTALITATPLPLPTGLTGRLAIWGGPDTLNTGYLQVGYFDFDLGGQYNDIGASMGENISFSVNGQRVAYGIYDQLLFSSSIEMINLNGTQKESIPQRWKGDGKTVLAPTQPRLGGPNRQYLVFVANTDKQNTTQVFLLNLNPAQGQDPLQQLTDDTYIYTDPVLSPDGSYVVVVRSDPNAATPTIDLVRINVSNGGKIPVTNDGASYAESSPSFSKDGSQVIFAAAPSNNPKNNDVYIRNADGTGSTLPFYQDAADDIDPVLSPDGKYLAFASNPNGNYDIYVYDIANATLSQLTNTPTNEYPGDWWQPG